MVTLISATKYYSASGEELAYQAVSHGDPCDNPVACDPNGCILAWPAIVVNLWAVGVWQQRPLDGRMRSNELK